MHTQYLKETRAELKSLNVKAATVLFHVILQKTQGCGYVFLIPMLKDDEKVFEYSDHLQRKKSLKHSAYTSEFTNVHINTQTSLTI